MAIFRTAMNSRAISGDGGGVDISLIKNISPITTFIRAFGLNAVMDPGDTIDVSSELSTFLTEQFVKCAGSQPLNVVGDPFTTFLFDGGAGNTGFIFPDIDKTTNGEIDIREVGISCRISGTFQGNLDSVVLVEYYMLDNAGSPSTLVGTMAFERQFQLDFTDRAQSLVSRLSKATSTLVQNGAKFIVRLPSTAPGTFTLTEIDFLITVGS